MWDGGGAEDVPGLVSRGRAVFEGVGLAALGAPRQRSRL